MDHSGELRAGDFSDWLTGAVAGVRQGAPSDVPCGGCTACCTSSQFVLVEPDEHDTIAHIPAELLFAAPGAPPGSRVLGFDGAGRCPMLVDERCSIYEHRPRTCRTYDCRVFTATGIEPDQPRIAARTRRWRFDHPGPRDQTDARTVRDAARFLDTHPDVLDAPRPNPLGLALAAVALHDLFRADPAPDPAAVRVEIARRRSR